MEQQKSQAYSLGLYEKAMPELSWPEKLQLAKQAGYDFVEISIDASEGKIARVYSGKAERKQLVDWMYELEMPIRTLNASALTKYALGDPDPAVRDRGMDIASHAIGLAADLGVRILMIPGYDVYFKPHSEETEELFEKAIRELSQQAAVAGVQLAFETMENDFMNTVQKGLRWVNKIGSNYLKLYPDIGNTTNGCLPLGLDPAEDLRSGGAAVAALHLKETRPGVYREIPYGTGHVDFERAVAAAWSIGVRRYVTEFWYKPNGETPEYVCKRFRALLDQQGNG